MDKELLEDYNNLKDKYDNLKYEDYVLVNEYNRLYENYRQFRDIAMELCNKAWQYMKNKGTVFEQQNKIIEAEFLECYEKFSNACKIWEKPKLGIVQVENESTEKN